MRIRQNILNRWLFLGLRQNSHGFTLIELLVVIAIIALLVSILMPSLKKARDLANETVCKTNTKSVHMAIMLYAEDFDGYAPPGAHGNWGPPYWEQYLMPYAGGVEMFACPAKAFDIAVEIPSWVPIIENRVKYNYPETGEAVLRRSYTANKSFIMAPGSPFAGAEQRITDMASRPDKKFIFFETASHIPALYAWSEYLKYEPWFDYVHDGGTHIMFLDGHLEKWDESEIFDNEGPGEF